MCFINQTNVVRYHESSLIIFKCLNTCLSIDDEIRIPLFYPSCSIAQFSTARCCPRAISSRRGSCGSLFQQWPASPDCPRFEASRVSRLLLFYGVAAKWWCDAALSGQPNDRFFHSFPRHICPSIRQYLRVTRSRGNLGVGLYRSGRA